MSEVVPSLWIPSVDAISIGHETRKLTSLLQSILDAQWLEEEDGWGKLRRPDASQSTMEHQDAPAGGWLAVTVETQEETLVHHVSFVTFYKLPPDQPDVDWNNLTPRTFAGFHTRVGGIVVVIAVTVAVDVSSGA
ncbi:hypothetical protein Tco_0173157 [Tanacetum coccineum]